MAFAQQDVACLALSWGFGRLARSSGSLECPRSPCWRTYNLASLKSESASLKLRELDLHGSGACWSLVSSCWGVCTNKMLERCRKP